MAWSSGAQSVRESIRIILSTSRTERIMRPEFGGGLQDFLFEPNTLTTRRRIEERAQRALTRWEPRIQVESVKARPVPDDPSAATLELTYRLRSSGTREQVRMTVQFEG